MLAHLKIGLDGVAKTWQAAILTLEQNPPEREFLYTRSYAALRAADLDWIVRPGCSLGWVHS